MHKNKRIILTISLLTFSLKNFAIDEHVKQWLAINEQNTFGDHQQWHALLYSQLRFIDQAHPWQSLLLEGGIGYQLVPHTTAWLGYRWSGQDPYHQFYQENRLFQQSISQGKVDFGHLIFRNRLEEISRTNSNQMGLRLRERLSIEINHIFLNHFFPMTYDEVFFQLNHPNYMPVTFLGENRLFLGFNLYESQKTWWEIGYINQYQIHTPQQPQNQMSHILSITYNFS